MKKQTLVVTMMMTTIVLTTTMMTPVMTPAVVRGIFHLHSECMHVRAHVCAVNGSSVHCEDQVKDCAFA